MTPDLADCTFAELWEYVAAHLARIGIQPELRQVGDVQIHILSPTDCVKDSVAQRCAIDMNAVQGWCKQEKSEWAFPDLINALTRGRKA